MQNDVNLTQKLDETIIKTRIWLDSLPPYHDKEFPSTSVAKQLASEAYEFATSVSDAIKRDNVVSAYANLRMLMDRAAYAARFVFDPTDLTEWARWSLAKLYYDLSNANSRGLMDNSADHGEGTKETLGWIRHWFRTDEGKDQIPPKPWTYPWETKYLRKQIIEGQNDYIRCTYDIASMYVHPTYRGADAINNDCIPSRTFPIFETARMLFFVFVVCKFTVVLFESDDEEDHGHATQELRNMIDSWGKADLRTCLRSF